MASQQCQGKGGRTAHLGPSMPLADAHTLELACLLTALALTTLCSLSKSHNGGISVLLKKKAPLTARKQSHLCFLNLESYWTECGRTPRPRRGSRCGEQAPGRQPWAAEVFLT